MNPSSRAADNPLIEGDVIGINSIDFFLPQPDHSLVCIANLTDLMAFTYMFIFEQYVLSASNLTLTLLNSILLRRQTPTSAGSVYIVDDDS